MWQVSHRLQDSNDGSVSALKGRTGWQGRRPSHQGDRAGMAEAWALCDPRGASRCLGSVREGSSKGSVMSVMSVISRHGDRVSLVPPGPSPAPSQTFPSHCSWLITTSYSDHHHFLPSLTLAHPHDGPAHTLTSGHTSRLLSQPPAEPLC